ncbi:MAG: ectoine hydroxylase [Candidatus Competibacteraceae bacterium]|nr:ectoine hydroxylase [Candidatus Competibacteraceae bacterium]
MIKRQDPVVYSEGQPPAPLNREQVQSYEENGFLFLDSLFSAEEVTAFAKELNRLSTRKDVRSAPESVLEPDSGEVRSIFRVHELSELFARLARDPRVLNVARHILGDEVYIHQSRINYKSGFKGRDFQWHSDFETWHTEDGMPRMRAVSMSVLLTDNNEHNGPLFLIPGSHNTYVSCVGETPKDNYKKSLRKQEIGVPDEVYLKLMTDQGGLVAPKGPAGSVLFFDCNTMHGSPSNISPYPRSNVFMVYNALSNGVRDPFGSQRSRPEFIATRDHIQALNPLGDDKPLIQKTQGSAWAA